MTTELEQEILRVLEASQYGLSVYAKPGADNISRAEIMDSIPTAIGPAGELAAEEVARTMDLSREEQEAEMRAFVPALKGAATGAAVATATTIPDIIGLGYGGVKALLAKEGEKGQAFLDGLSSISGAVGSEKAGQIYAEYVGGLDATDEEKAAMMTGYQAGEFGGIPGLAGAYQIVKKGLPIAADMAVEAGKAAKARMEGGTTLTSGANPDAAIAALGDAVAKFRAPTEKEPGIIAFHGSGADFDEFKLEKIGTGEGAQAYGYGLYFTDSESIAKFYRDSVSAIDRYAEPDFDTMAGGWTEELGFDLTGGQRTLSSADPDYDYYIKQLDDFAVDKTTDLTNNSRTWQFSDGSELTMETDTVPTFNGKPLDSVYTQDVEDRFGIDIKKVAEEAKKIGIRDDVDTLEDDINTIIANLSQGLYSKQDMKAAIDSLGPSSRYQTIYKKFIEPNIDFNKVDYVTLAGNPKGKMYKVGLEPKPEDMLDYQGTFADQPKNVQDALKAIGYEVETNKVGQKNPQAQIDLAMRRPMPMILESLKGRIIENIDAGKQDPGPADKILSEKLLEQGVPGIKYRAAGSRGANVDSASAEYNYVIFDDKMIKILEKYGIVGPVAITGIAASQQEGESDGQSS